MCGWGAGSFADSVGQGCALCLLRAVSVGSLPGRRWGGVGGVLCLGGGLAVLQILWVGGVLYASNVQFLWARWQG